MSMRLPGGKPLDHQVRPDWLALCVEAPMEPDLPIIDAHHHLWDHPGWEYLFGDFLADLRTGHRIVATIFVQCGAMYRADGPERMKPVGETEFVNGVAAMAASGIYGETSVCAGIVGFSNLLLGAGVEAVLDAHMRAAPDRFRGIRQISAWDPDPVTFHVANAPSANLLADPRFREGFARLAPRALSFDAWLFAPQIDELTDLAQAFPETSIILNHAGTPLGVGSHAGRREDMFDSWRKSIRRLGTCPNVSVKLGGMSQYYTGFGWPDLPQPPSSKDLAAAWLPYFEACIESFSPQRCMFESNFPVDKRGCGYGTFWNACKRMTSGYSKCERANLFADTAARTYRIAHPPLE